MYKPIFQVWPVVYFWSGASARAWKLSENLQFGRNLCAVRQLGFDPKHQNKSSIHRYVRRFNYYVKLNNRRNKIYV